MFSVYNTTSYIPVTLSDKDINLLLIILGSFVVMIFLSAIFDSNRPSKNNNKEIEPECKVQIPPLVFPVLDNKRYRIDIYSVVDNNDDDDTEEITGQNINLINRFQTLNKKDYTIEELYI